MQNCCAYLSYREEIVSHPGFLHDFFIRGILAANTDILHNGIIKEGDILENDASIVCSD